MVGTTDIVPSSLDYTTPAQPCQNGGCNRPDRSSKDLLGLTEPDHSPDVGSFSGGAGSIEPNKRSAGGFLAQIKSGVGSIEPNNAAPAGSARGSGSGLVL